MATGEGAYCPDCGSELSRRRVDGRERPYCGDCERNVAVGGPRPRGAVVVIDQGRTLLTERDDGRWTVPGDAIDRGEAPTAAAARGLRSATGLAADPDDLALVDVRPVDADTLSVCYAVGLPTTRGYVTGGATDVRFFAPEELRGDGYEFVPHAPIHAGAALQRVRET